MAYLLNATCVLLQILYIVFEMALFNVLKINFKMFIYNLYVPAGIYVCAPHV